MPNQNAIVGNIERIMPPVEKQTPAEVLRKSPDGVTIEFSSQQTARLYPSDRAAVMLQILDQLRQMDAPVYVEVRPENQGVIKLLIPLVTRVAKINESGQQVEVELELSHALHQLQRGQANFAELLAALINALKTRSWLIVTEDEEQGIIDVRRSLREPKIPGPDESAAEPSRRRRPWFRRWFRCLCCVSAARAQQLFDLCSSQTCNPQTVPPPCIPFLYPDDGCWARAHEMCRLMSDAGAKPRKVWIDGRLRTPTRNHPQCFVGWGWHVAPTICVRRRFCRVEHMVIDPSLFTTPVSKATWQSVQGDPNATLTDTSATVYWRNVIPTDPNYVDTNMRLQYYRLQLQNRSINVGPPPYAQCP